MMGAHSVEKDAKSDECSWKDLFLEFRGLTEERAGKTFEKWEAIKYTQ